jgi:hypothetical protein
LNLDINNAAVKHDTEDMRQLLLCTGNYKDVMDGKKTVGSHIEFIYDRQLELETAEARFISSMTLFLFPTTAEAEVAVTGNLYKDGKLIMTYKSKVITEEKYSILYLFNPPVDMLIVRKKIIEKGINDITMQIKRDLLKKNQK